MWLLGGIDTDIRRDVSLFQVERMFNSLVAAFGVKNEWCHFNVTHAPTVAYRAHCRDSGIRVVARRRVGGFLLCGFFFGPNLQLDVGSQWR